MTTDLERLSVWMAKQGYTSESLSLALGYRHDWLKTIFAGERGIRFGFHVHFAATFGEAEYESVFGDSPDGLPARHKHWAVQAHAQSAVSKAVQMGELLPATAYKCHGCDKQARQHHHQSYLPGDWLCVVPLCLSCHRRHHTGKAPLTFGVVPTSVGLVRIAIAAPTAA